MECNKTPNKTEKVTNQDSDAIVNLVGKLLADGEYTLVQNQRFNSYYWNLTFSNNKSLKMPHPIINVCEIHFYNAKLNRLWNDARELTLALPMWQKGTPSIDTLKDKIRQGIETNLQYLDLGNNQLVSSCFNIEERSNRCAPDKKYIVCTCFIFDKANVPGGVNMENEVVVTGIVSIIEGLSPVFTLKELINGKNEAIDAAHGFGGDDESLKNSNDKWVKVSITKSFRLASAPSIMPYRYFEGKKVDDVVEFEYKNYKFKLYITDYITEDGDTVRFETVCNKINKTISDK
jgi:hypothetical protein